MRTFVLLSLCLLAASQQYNLVWSDEFNGNSLDTTKWQYEVNCDGGGNNELQCYTNSPSNVAVTGGNLVITAVPQNYNGMQYTSGRINTAASAAWKYGRFDIRAKLPNGAYLWPALWMMPRDSVYGWWAASGEIDIMEARGQLLSKIESTLHYGGSWPNDIYTGSGPTDMGVDLSADFHVYSCIWDSSQVSFSLDGNVYYSLSLNRNWWGGIGPSPYTANGQPFDQYFYFIINLAVGGGFFGTDANSLTQQQAEGWASPSLVVDYVRVYQLSNNPVTPPAPVAAPVSTGSSASCQAMYSQATCRTISEDPTQVDASLVTGARTWLCNAYPQYCANINSGGVYSSCNSVEQLSNAMSIYYNNFYPTLGNSACNFAGAGFINQAAVSTSTSPAATSSSTTTCSTAGCGAGLCNCNGACYQPSMYCCPSGSLIQIALCPASNAPAATSTTPATTSAAAAVATPNGLQTASYCGTGLYACNGACYSTSQYCCVNGGLLQRSFC